MFIKVIKYKIKKSTLEDWEKITKAADLIYKKYGEVVSWLPMYRKGKDSYSIVEVSVYKTEEEFLSIYKNANEDSELLELYNRFEKILFTNKISEEAFETFS
ncbi:MAG TPA: hypothetical protein ENI23_11645 [bacterium]|nr:hypothetical protein [bacterium]